MSEDKNFHGTIVEVGAPERSANGQNWKMALVKIQEKGGDFVKSFRVWPYEQGSDSQTTAYAAALANKGQEVHVVYQDGGFQGRDGWVNQFYISAISGPSSTTAVNTDSDWGAVNSSPPTDGALSVAEGAILDIQAAADTAINAIRSAVKTGAEF